MRIPPRALRREDGRLLGSPSAFHSGPWRHTWPFVVIAGVAFAVSFASGAGAHRYGLLAFAVVAAVVDGVVVLLVAPGTLPRWARQLPVVLWCLTVLALSHWRGPTDTYLPLLLLPLIWQAAFGDRLDLLITIALVSATVGTIVGLPESDESAEARRAVMWVLTVGGTGVMIQGLVRANRRKEETMAAVVRLAGVLDQAPDPAAAVVETAGALTGADVVVLHRAVGEQLSCAATWPSGLPDPAEQPGPTSGLVRAAEGKGDGILVAQVASSADPLDRWFGEAGVRTVLHVSPQRQGWARLVLSLGWFRKGWAPSEDVRTVASLVAHEAWVALGRADLVADLATAASHDPLTGLLNRRAWDELLAEEVDHARRLHRPLALALLDLDHFKDFNDRHGHVRGDELLAAAGQAWTDELREGDSLARWGGEEFVVVLPGTGIDEARQVVERLRHATPGLTVSAGVAMLRSGMSPTELVRAADQALYDAKRAGRDRTVVAAADADGGGTTGPVS